MKTIKSLKHSPKNPRKISHEKLGLLKKSLQEFGDLSGIVYNQKLDRLSGGHQRIKSIPEDAEIVIEREYQEPTQAGTIAEGFIKLGTERMSYRVVEWDEVKDVAANIAANKHGGEFDIPRLVEHLLDLDTNNYDLGLTGFTESEIEGLLAPIVEPKSESSDEQPNETCPHCNQKISN